MSQNTTKLVTRDHVHKTPEGFVREFQILPTPWDLIAMGAGPYDVRVITSVDYGKTFWYCGIGRHCHNLTEAFEYITSY